MTPEEIREAVRARPDLAGVTSSEIIASELSKGRTKIASRMLSERGLLDQYPGGTVAAHTMLSAVEKFTEAFAASSPLAGICARAIRFLRQPEGLDFGAPSTQVMLDSLVQAGVINSEQRAHLRAMVEMPDAVTEYEVRVALWHDDGTPRS